MRYIFILFIILVTNIQALDNFSRNTINSMKKKYGNRTEKVLVLWDKTLHKAKKSSSLNKLKIINDFFNKFRYKTDIRHWKVRDYWASPFEFVGTKAGDCEDYAIAKYFALKKVGISEKKLRIAYVKYKTNRTKFEQAHMVLLYFHKVNAIPIVLDNIKKRLKLASKRRDLKLVYSFNGSGLWRAKNRGKYHKRVGSNKLRKWKNLLNKI